MKLDLDSSALLAFRVEYWKKKAAVRPLVRVDVRHTGGFNQFRYHRVQSENSVFQGSIIQVFGRKVIDQAGKVTQDQFDLLKIGDIGRNGINGHSFTRIKKVFLHLANG